CRRSSFVLKISRRTMRFMMIIEFRQLIFVYRSCIIFRFNNKNGGIIRNWQKVFPVLVCQYYIYTVGNCYIGDSFFAAVFDGIFVAVLKNVSRSSWLCQ